MKTTRRNFLKSTSAVAAAAPFILPSRIWSADVKPNDRITMGFIGMGKQNQYLLRHFMNLKGTQAVAVCDVDTTRRQDARKRVEGFYADKNEAASFKGCEDYNDYQKLLARDDIDAVCIATPDHWHALMTIDAAKAKKDIYCEKPLCQSIREARRMVNAVRFNKRVFQTGSMQRSSEEFRVACELVRNGIIGPISRVEVAVGGPAKPCDLPEEEMEPGLDWDRWLGPAPKRPFSSVLSPRGVHNHYPAWRHYREYGGGGVTDWGAHHFDIAQWGLGMDNEGPRRIIPSEKPESGSGVRLVYQNGVEMVHAEGNGVTFYGKDGKVNVNRGQFKFWLGDKLIADNRNQCKQIEQEYLADAKVRLYRSSDHKKDFLDCMRTRTRPNADVEIGARTVTVCHLVNLAYYHNQHMHWNPFREQFMNGKGDKSWLDVEHRAPYTFG
jgi:predicted dehydrogenase